MLGCWRLRLGLVREALPRCGHARGGNAIGIAGALKHAPTSGVVGPSPWLVGGFELAEAAFQVPLLGGFFAGF